MISVEETDPAREYWEKANLDWRLINDPLKIQLYHQTHDANGNDDDDDDDNGNDDDKEQMDTTIAAHQSQNGLPSQNLSWNQFSSQDLSRNQLAAKHCKLIIQIIVASHCNFKETFTKIFFKELNHVRDHSSFQILDKELLKRWN